MNGDNRTKDWVLERVRKLLTLGRNAGATDGERDNAMRMAHKLLAKYNLEMAEAESHGETIDEARILERGDYYGRPWARVVSAAIAKLFFCSYIYTSAKKATDTQHFFIGRKSNATTAKMMAQWIVEAIRKEARARNRDEGTGDNAWMRSFCIGASVVVYQRVEEMMKPAHAEPGTALVLASHYAKEKLLNDALKNDKFKNQHDGRSGKSTGHRDAYDQGQVYGESIQLKTQVGGPVNRPRITQE